MPLPGRAHLETRFPHAFGQRAGRVLVRDVQFLTALPAKPGQRVVEMSERLERIRRGRACLALTVRATPPSFFSGFFLFEILAQLGRCRLDIGAVVARPSRLPPVNRVSPHRLPVVAAVGPTFWQPSKINGVVQSIRFWFAGPCLRLTFMNCADRLNRQMPAIRADSASARSGPKPELPNAADLHRLSKTATMPIHPSNCLPDASIT